MIKELAAYLQQKGEPVSSQELAHQVLKMTAAPAVLADKLLASIIKEDSSFVHDASGCWQLQTCGKKEELLLVKNSFLLFKAFPSHISRWPLWTDCSCGLLADGVYQKLAWPIRTFLYNKASSFLNYPLVVEGFDNQASQLRLAGRALFDMDIGQPLLTLRRLGALVFSGQVLKNPAELARLLLVNHYEEAIPELQLESASVLLQLLLERLQAQDIRSLSMLLEKYQPIRREVDYSCYNFDDEFISSLPLGPGVYIMRDRQEQVLYVGKAKNLFERTSSYFQDNGELDEKLASIREQLYHLQILQTGSELEALLLEQQLISHLRPPINRQLQVQSRSHRQKSRYPRILLLGSVIDSSFSLFFVHPDKELRSLRIDATQPTRGESATDIFDQHFLSDQWHDLEQEIDAYFFAMTPPVARDVKREIAVSWLSGNEAVAESIDMRGVLTAEETVRLLKAYLFDGRAQGKRIFY